MFDLFNAEKLYTGIFNYCPSVEELNHSGGLHMKTHIGREHVKLFHPMAEGMYVQAPHASQEKRNTDHRG